MVFNKKNLFKVIGAILLVMGPVLFSRYATAEECDCTSDTAEPPFLSAGADSNLLLLIDNSASMYDLAYNDTTKQQWECFDESFNAANTYVGYFNRAQWYLYDSGQGKFTPIAAPPAAAVHGGTLYKSKVGDDVSAEMWGSDAVGWHVELRATGNFLNWASASKFDIEKQILTGGKYHPVDRQWISEGRGCAGYRFVKQVALTAGGVNYKLTMGIRADASDDTPLENETTVMDIFKINASGYDYGLCKTAIEEVMYGTGNPQNAVSNCIDPNNLAKNPEKQVLIHSTTDCWKFWKGDLNNWPQHTTALLEECSRVYDSGLDPREISPSNSAYACYGDNPNNAGFIGRCWVPTVAAPCPTVLCASKPVRGGNDPYYRCNGGDGYVEYCAKNDYKNGACKVPWKIYYAPGTCPEDAGAGWIEGYDGNGPIPAALDACMVDAMTAYCGYAKVSQVVDPSDQEFSTGEVYNLPAILIDGGVEGQLDRPIAMLNVVVKNADGASEPKGVLQKYASKIRIGAMAFNHDGSATECDTTNPYITYDCDDPANRDGARVVWNIGQEGDLAAGINAVKATSWTPLAEAFYNAIGYYAQRSDLRLHPDDFEIDEIKAPITAYCQKNHILMISDGASTADKAGDMTALAAAGGDGDGADKGCGDLHGTTYLDDLAKYGWEGDVFAGSPYAAWGVGTPEENIMSFFILSGTPDTTGDGECAPKTLLDNAAANGGTNAALLAEDPEKLEAEIEKVFKSVMERAAAGSAASVIAATRSGEGAVYQAIFWPDVIDKDKNIEAKWLGEVHALLVDAYGTFYEDTNGNAALDGADTPVILYLDIALNRTMACNGAVVGGACAGTRKELHEVNYLWSAARWLGEISDADILSNRVPYISNTKKRHIFTWNDLDNNGIVGATEILPYVAATDWEGQSLAMGRDPIPRDFGVTTDAEVDAIVNWMRGLDSPLLRKREVARPPNFNIAGDPATITWRLGDIVHSTPTAVGRPAEVYHLIYKDQSYADFYNKHQNRRHVVYFGGNDGMLHAVNGGFYDPDGKRFTRSKDGASEAFSPELGAELWAYVPYNLQPHLKCLTAPGYLHKYYIDSKPRIFDVNIFTPDADVHVNGWGTILVAGMRFGGSMIQSASDGRQFRSAYVIFDITDPENPPTLLGELTYDPATSADMGYTIGIPAVVPMRKIELDATGNVSAVVHNKWYLVVGSGPTDNRPIMTDLTGNSVQMPRIAVFPLDLLGTAPFRIPSAAPGAATPGSIALPGAGLGFVADPVVIDYSIRGLNIGGNTVYFGTTEGTWGAWSGKLYRWVTSNAEPYNMDDMVTPDQWRSPSLVFDPGKPITSAPAFGTDGFNFWVYFGTGRFYDKRDKTDAGSMAQNAFFGLKEPITISLDPTDPENRMLFTWATITNSKNAMTDPPAAADLPGSRGLLRVDQIVVTKNSLASQADVGCASGSCLPAGITKFNQLDDFVGGTGFFRTDGKPTGYTGTDGWYLDFKEVIEKNVGQSTLLGGLVTFTTYEPYDDVCKPEGEANLYGVYYRTGTAWHKQVFDPGSNEPRVELGLGLATTPNLHVGRDDGAKAFVQTSTGEIVKIDQKELPLGNVKSGKTKWMND